MVSSLNNWDSAKTSNYFQKKSSSMGNLSVGIVREYMNGAVCIETPLDNAHRKIQIQNYNIEQIPLKRISCSCSSVRLCKVHENEEKCKDTEITSNVGKHKEILNGKTQSDDIKLSTTLLVRPATSSESTEQLKEDNYRKWTLRKKEEKKRIEENIILLKQNKEMEKQKQLEQERKNFKRWLSIKKNEEEKRKLEKEKQLEQGKIKEAHKERRNHECKLRYQLWLKKKEQGELEKKLQQQMKILQISDEKQRRIEENEKAYLAWLESSKNKPKPIPSSQGLDSLRSSASVMYINPVPWSPNIDERPPKPVSQ